ncbi:MAG: signal peptidase II [Angustibacter sp.]
MQTASGAPLGATFRSARRRGHFVILALSCAVVLAADQLSKVLAVARLSPNEVVPLVGDFLRLQLIRNPGAALSFATEQTWLLTVVAVVVVLSVGWAARRVGHRGWAVALGLLLGGALGNLVDRFLRSPGVGRGHVVDFIAYGSWFIGNIADIAIVLAALAILGLSLAGITVDGRRSRRRSGGRRVRG